MNPYESIRDRIALLEAENAALRAQAQALVKETALKCTALVLDTGVETSGGLWILCDDGRATLASAARRIAQEFGL